MAYTARDNHTETDVQEQAPPYGIEGLVREFAPLVRRTARRYEGRGAERDDLEQEGYLALIQLAERDMKGDTARYLKNHLPGYVRDAAARMRTRLNTVTLSADDDDSAPGLEDIIPDCRTEVELEELEIKDMLERALHPEDLNLTLALCSGRTQTEMASSLGVTRQRVRRSIKRIREQLKERVGSSVF